MGKTHEDSVREMAAKTPYKVGVVHDKIIIIKAALVQLLLIFSEPDRYNAFQKLKALDEARKVAPLINELPEPTLENCKYPNSKLLVIIRDEFMGHLVEFTDRDKCLRVIINGIIIIYEYDPPYRHLMDWWLEQIFNLKEIGQWLPRAQGKPSVHYWKEEVV